MTTNYHNGKIHHPQTLDLDTDSNDSDLIVEKVVTGAGITCKPKLLAAEKKVTQIETKKAKTKTIHTTVGSSSSTRQINYMAMVDMIDYGQDSDEDELPDIPEPGPDYPSYPYSQFPQSPPKRSKTSPNSEIGHFPWTKSNGKTKTTLFPSPTKERYIEVLDLEDDILDVGFPTYSKDNATKDKNTGKSSSKTKALKVIGSSSSTSSSSKNSAPTSTSSFKNLMEAIAKSTSSKDSSVKPVAVTVSPDPKSQSHRSKAIKETLSSATSSSSKCTNVEPTVAATSNDPRGQSQRSKPVKVTLSSATSSSTSSTSRNVETNAAATSTGPKSQSQQSKPTKGTSSSSTSGSCTTQTSTNSLKIKEKEDREREKELKRLERELKKQELVKKKQELDKEKELKKVENELRKNVKPGEAEKFLTMQLDENLPHKDELISFFLEREFNYEIVTKPLYEKSITFRRETKYQSMDNNMKLQLISRFEDETEVLIFMSHEDIVPKVYQEIHNDPSADDISLTNYVKSIQCLDTSKKITLLVYGIENYFKKLKKSSQQEFRDRVLNGEQDKRQKRKKNQLPHISSLEFQSVMIEVQLTTNINYRLVNRVKELGTLITQYLKAIAAAPFKRLQKEQGFDWFASADSCGSVKIEKDGTGLATLWLEQIQLFGKVGVDTAQGIVRHYPTPYHLYKAYKNCQSHDDGMNLLRDISVRTGIGPLARTRRVGPELSKKIYRFFTSTDPDRCLGSQRDF